MANAKKFCIILLERENCKSSLTSWCIDPEVCSIYRSSFIDNWRPLEKTTPNNDFKCRVDVTNIKKERNHNTKVREKNNQCGRGAWPLAIYGFHWLPLDSLQSFGKHTPSELWSKRLTSCVTLADNNWKHREFVQETYTSVYFSWANSTASTEGLLWLIAMCVSTSN